MADLKAACHKLAQSLVTLLSSFESISVRLHSIDLQHLTSPLRPSWDSMRNDLRELVQEFRNNAWLLSSRLKVFSNHILPLTLRRQSGVSASLREDLSVIQSFLQISSDQATQVTSLLSSSIKLTGFFNSFHVEFCRFASHKTGHNHVQELASKLGVFANDVKELHGNALQLVTPDVTHLAYTTLRMTDSSGTRRSRLSHRHLALKGELCARSLLYECCDKSRSEVAHLQYVSQVAHQKSDVLTTCRASISDLLNDLIVSTERCLSFFLAIWSTLRVDCFDILHWLQKGTVQSENHSCVVTFLSAGRTLYPPLADCLDAFTGAIDPVDIR